MECAAATVSRDGHAPQIIIENAHIGNPVFLCEADKAIVGAVGRAVGICQVPLKPLRLANSFEYMQQRSHMAKPSGVRTRVENTGEYRRAGLLRGLLRGLLTCSLYQGRR